MYFNRAHTDYIASYVLVQYINLSERNFVAEECIYTVMLFHNVDMMCFHSRCEAQ